MSADERRIALLIDGDNSQSELIGKTLTEVSKQGKVTVKRIYGDWASSQMKGWKDKVNKYALKPVQQFAYVKKKNATDTALIIDAMDILHSKLVSGFCIVSSDSDYTGLANRIREEGVFVMGIGQEKTPDSFIKACEIFIYTENLLAEKSQAIYEEKTGSEDFAPDGQKLSEKVRSERARSKRRPSSTDLPRETQDKGGRKIPLDLIREAFNIVVQENELAYLGELGVALRKIDPSFDPRTYGYRLLSKLLKSVPEFEVIYSDNLDSAYVKLKKENTPLP